MKGHALLEKWRSKGDLVEISKIAKEFDRYVVHKNGDKIIMGISKENILATECQECGWGHHRFTLTKTPAWTVPILPSYHMTFTTQNIMVLAKWLTKPYALRVSSNVLVGSRVLYNIVQIALTMPFALHKLSAHYSTFQHTLAVLFVTLLWEGMWNVFVHAAVQLLCYTISQTSATLISNSSAASMSAWAVVAFAPRRMATSIISCSRTRRAWRRRQREVSDIVQQVVSCSNLFPIQYLHLVFIPLLNILIMNFWRGLLVV